MEIAKVARSGYVPTATKKERAQTPTDREQIQNWVDTFQKSQAAKEKENNSPYGPEWIAEQIRSADEQAKAKAKELKVLLNCQKIAGHIMAGDKVDPKDLQYLMEHDPKAYQLAMSMRKPKQDPEECDRITEDEEEKVQGVTGSAPPELGGSVGEVATAPAEGGEMVTA